ncbi:MAG: FtsX-like permease family protein, partial [Candidatus Rokuibacteriota bacterium]
LWKRLETEFGTTPNSPGKGWGSRLVPLLEQQLGYYRPALMVLFGATALLLLIGVINVASLQLTRAISRAREMALRAALGASTRQLVAQMTVEGLVLALFGAALGVAAAWAGLSALTTLTLVEIPRFEEARLNLRALALAGSIAVITTVVFALVPALALRRVSVAAELKSGERGSSPRARLAYSALVSVQVALACALLVGSLLLVRTVRQMTATPLGVNADEVLVTTIQLPRSTGPQATLRQRWGVVATTHNAFLDSIRR